MKGFCIAALLLILYSRSSPIIPIQDYGVIHAEASVKLDVIITVIERE
jgi:hypothetical protein